MDFDYCPYCDHEIEVYDVFEISDVTGNENAELIECPNCGKMLRADLELRTSMTLYSEEDYLDDCTRLQNSYKEELKTDYGKDNNNFYEYRIKQLTDEIKQVHENIKYNNEVLGDFNDL